MDLAELNLWKAKFRTNICSSKTTRKSWQEIEQAGIAGEAVFLLFWYARGHFAVKDFADRNWEAVEIARTAQRAIGKAKEKQGDPREAMFAKRAQEKITAAANAPWINPYNSPYQTVANAVVAIGNPPFDQLPGVMAKSGEAVRRSGTMHLLRTLQLYAEKHGIRLGLKRLSALAGCADAEREQDIKNLSRFFNYPDVEWNDSLLLADFEHYLPKLRSRLREFFAIASIS